MREDVVLERARFSDSVRTYWTLSGIITLTASVVGIPLILVWLLVAPVFTKRYLDSMECVLTRRTLKIKKGVLIRTEKTIPLEKITDMGMVQGPIQRQMNLHTVTVETAGQSGQGALVSLTGIVDPEGFRETVLNRRDELSERGRAEPAHTTEPRQTSDNAVLTEIRDALLRIEKRLEQ
jgi:putative membrane protein